MCELALRDFFPNNFPVKVNDIEIQNQKFIPTYYLMKQLHEKHKNEAELYFIIGSDLLKTLH